LKGRAWGAQLPAPSGLFVGTCVAEAPTIEAADIADFDRIM
jgi:hypothetical protein